MARRGTGCSMWSCAVSMRCNSTATASAPCCANLPTHPGLALVLGLATQGSMAWMLEAAGVPATGWRGTLRVQGLTAVWLYTLRAWLADESADLSGTMAALDRALGRAEQFGDMLDEWRLAAAEAFSGCAAAQAVLPGRCSGKIGGDEPSPPNPPSIMGPRLLIVMGGWARWRASHDGGQLFSARRVSFTARARSEGSAETAAKASASANSEANDTWRPVTSDRACSAMTRTIRLRS